MNQIIINIITILWKYIEVCLLEKELRAPMR